MSKSSRHLKEKSAEAKLSHERLCEILRYSKNTGLFIWRIDAGKNRSKGKIAGCEAKGYWKLCINYISYAAHRVAWFYVTKKWPAELIDHENGIGIDNRWKNLRQASVAQNQQNRKRLSVSGFKGVSFCTHTGRWRARMKINGKQLCLGRHDTAEQAAQTYDVAARKRYASFARLNFPSNEEQRA